MKKQDQIPLMAYLAHGQMKEFNAIYEPACQALADWFIQNPKKYLLSNSGQAFRLETLNTEGTWFFIEISGKRRSIPDYWIRFAFTGHMPTRWENTNGKILEVKPGDLNGPMNFVAPLFRKWSKIIKRDFKWVPHISPFLDNF